MTFDRSVVLDACALVGAGLRDTLLRLAEVPALYAPRWTEGKTVEQTRHLAQQLWASFPETWVQDYRDLIPALSNHEKDRHVLAAAVRCGAQSIVTFNTRHFPSETLHAFDIEILHPVEFLIEQLCLAKSLVAARFSEQATNIGRPVAEQARAFHLTRSLPRFTHAMARALSLQLD